MITAIKLAALIIGVSVLWIALDFLIECILDKTLRKHLRSKRENLS